MLFPNPLEVEAIDHTPDAKQLEQHHTRMLNQYDHLGIGPNLRQRIETTLRRLTDPRERLAATRHLTRTADALTAELNKAADAGIHVDSHQMLTNLDTLILSIQDLTNLPAHTREALLNHYCLQHLDRPTPEPDSLHTLSNTKLQALASQTLNQELQRHARQHLADRTAKTSSPTAQLTAAITDAIT